MNKQFLDQASTLQPFIDAFKKDIDRTLIRENLKLSPEQRLLKLMQLQRFADELHRAGHQARLDNNDRFSQTVGAPDRA